MSDIKFILQAIVDDVTVYNKTFDTTAELIECLDDAEYKVEDTITFDAGHEEFLDTPPKTNRKPKEYENE